MKAIINCFLVLLIMCGIGFAQTGGENNCVVCHAEIDSLSALKVEHVAASVHHDASLSCQGCHGGDASTDDPDQAMSPKNGFIGVPTRSEIPRLCAKCHSDINFMRNYNPNIATDQYSRYLTSVHGQRWSQGDTKAAICTDCHGAHEILGASDPRSLVFAKNIADACGRCHADPEYMKEYGIATDQVDEYKKSVHAQMLYERGDLGAPTCNDCHGNHSATPPNVQAVANVCGTCHYMQAQYFASSPHKMAYDEMEIAECEACHGNHGIVKPTNAMIGTDGDAVCLECHDTDSEGFRVAGVVRTALDSLTYQVDKAENMLLQARRAGVETPAEKSLALNRAKDALTQAKTAIHTFSDEKVLEFTSKGEKEAVEALTVGSAALEELGARRQMLILMVILTLVVAGLLMLYIRAREGQQA